MCQASFNDLSEDQVTRVMDTVHSRFDNLVNDLITEFNKEGIIVGDLKVNILDYVVEHCDHLLVMGDSL